jgi:hypothetical protein
MSECNCGANQDQTPDACIKAGAAAAAASKESVRGYGMFLVPAPEKGPLKTKTILVGDLAIEECTERGHLCIAFKWMHEGVVSFKEMESRLSDPSVMGKCPWGGHCDTSSDCEFHCWCNGNGRCRQG